MKIMVGEMKRIKLSYMSHTYLRILPAVLALGCPQAEKPICTLNMLNQPESKKVRQLLSLHPESLYLKP
jgi:hypothetical protein